jgi:hypothetical protein
MAVVNAVAVGSSKMGPGYKETVYALLGTGGTTGSGGGAFLGIPCTIACRRMEIAEIPVGAGTVPAPQGLQYQLLQYDNTGLSNYGPVINQPYPGVQILLGEQVAEWKGRGSVIGFPTRPAPGQANIPATVPIQLASQTATATTVVVREYP